MLNVQQHIRDRKHRKFSKDDSNYLQLDFVLNRVQRRTQQQYKEQEQQCSTGNEQQTCSEDYPMCSSPLIVGNEEEDLWDCGMHDEETLFLMSGETS